MEEPLESKQQKSQLGAVAAETCAEESSRALQPTKLVVLADLNVDPPEADEDESSHVVPTPEISRLANYENSQDKSLLSKDTDSQEGEGKKLNKLGKCCSRLSKIDSSLDCGAEADGDQPVQGAPSSREEKVSSMKTGLVHVVRKMPKNAHAHFMIGLMYQRLNQPQKAVGAYEKATEILLQSEAEIGRPELLSLVQIHHAQCLILESSSENSSDKELEPQELEEILSKLKESVQSDIRQSAVWNTLGFILLKTGRVQSAISVLSSLLATTPENYDCLGNLGIAYLQIGNLELSAKCFQDLILRDHNHPAALINYAALLLCKYASVVAGAGASAAEGASVEQVMAVNVAKECLLAAIKAGVRSAHIWANLANAFYTIGDHRSSGKCLEKAAKLEPNCMSTRYAVAIRRMKEAERSQDPSKQLSWAGNEIASIVRDGDSSLVELPIARAGLAVVHKAQHEIASVFESEQHGLIEVGEHAVCSLKQAVAEDPDDAVQWHQLGLHNLCARKFKTSQKYLKAALAGDKDCSYAWSNLADWSGTIVPYPIRFYRGRTIPFYRCSYGFKMHENHHKLKKYTRTLWHWQHLNKHMLYFPTWEISIANKNNINVPRQCLQSHLNYNPAMLLHLTIWVLCLLPRVFGKKPSIVSTRPSSQIRCWIPPSLT